MAYDEQWGSHHPVFTSHPEMGQGDLFWSIFQEGSFSVRVFEKNPGRYSKGPGSFSG
jgi:hypothetical protein